MPIETLGLIARIATALNIPAGPQFFELLTQQLGSTMGADRVVFMERMPDGRDHVLASMGPAHSLEGLMQLPLVASNGRTLGAIGLSFTEPLVADQTCEDALKIFAARAAAELERQQAEDALRASERRYREFIAHSMEGVWRIEFEPPIPLELSEDEIIERALRDGILVEFNDAFVRINGFTSGEQLQGARIGDLPDMRTRIDGLRDQFHLPVHTATTSQVLTRTNAGESIYFERTVIPIVERRRLVRAWGITRDITKAKLAEDGIREAEERYHGLFEAAGEAILVSRDSVVDCNSRAQHLFGATREQILTRQPWEFSPEFQPDGSNSRESIQRRTELALQGIPSAFDWQYRRLDGTLFDGHVTLGPVMIAGVPHRVALIRDITERKRAERQIQELNAELERLVAQRTAQLEGANRELEAFSYSVSHDVRAAIRGIYACSKIVLDDYGSRLNGKGRGWLETICEDSQQLDQVTKELLELSRLARARLDPEEVDFSAIARSVARRLSEAQPDRQAQFRVAEGIRAYADEALLRVVLEHLIGNAWKFTRTREAAEIEVGLAPGDAVYFVRDNGVGFESSKAGQLFNAFERLHSPDEFEGTGIGLATVRRLIHRHGGRVWAKGDEGLGAAIFFTLPRLTHG
jgi:PAS domain S-box-containing protein